MHEKLYKLRDAAMQELEGMGDRLESGRVEVAENLASLICKLD